MATIQAVFGWLLGAQFAAVVLHDWLNIQGWTHGAQVQRVIGRRRLLAATLINATFPGLAVAFAVWFRGSPRPTFVANYWLLYCGVTVLSAIAMWYVPYFLCAFR